jgi:hypothetical protein
VSFTKVALTFNVDVPAGYRTQYTLTPSSPLVNSTTGEVWPNAPQTVTLNSQGQGAMTVPATNDATPTPAGITYAWNRTTVSITGQVYTTTGTVSITTSLAPGPVAFGTISGGG